MVGQTKTVDVKHNGETVEVPTVFERSELAAWFGDVPDTFEIDRVFVFEGNLRAESYQGGDEWVEVTYQTEDSAPIFNATEIGWVGQVVNAPQDGENPGVTEWTRE